MKFWNDPAIVNKTPIATVFLLEGANVNQLYRMWSEHTAAGQSLWGWILVNAALLLWLNFYRICVPKEHRAWSFWATAFGVLMNVSVIASVIWFRYLLPL